MPTLLPNDDERFAAIEEAIRAARSRRHLMLTLDRDGCWVGAVAEEHRALRTPQGPYRPAVLERIADLPGTQAVLAPHEGPAVRVPLVNDHELERALARMGSSGRGGDLSFDVPRRAVLDVLILVATMADRLHREGIVHADLTPGNVLLHRGEPVSFDALAVEVGQVSPAATFRWAPPEQITARPLGPSCDVYSIGKMAAELVGAVAFGEEIRYLVPTGGRDRETVSMLKTEGVFVDISDSDHDRSWQRSWQDVLSRCLAYDPDQRIGSAAELATLLSELAEAHAPAGSLRLDGSFGELASVRCDGESSFARVVFD